MTQRRLVLSTVGISTLLRPASRELGRRLIQAANAQVLKPQLSRDVDALQAKVRQELSADDVERNRRLSAELNGLYSLYQGQLARGRRDMHVLIATDTALGRLAAELVREYLQSKDFTVDVYAPPELSTATPAAFSRGIKELIEWCEKTIPGYQENGYRVIFNLTGGFKSLQGYLNIVGMFYADQLVYIFEGSKELLTIPRLPIQIAYQTLKEYRVPLAMMAQGHIIPRAQIPDLPGGLLDIDGAVTTLSDWGLLVWNRAREQLLTHDLMPLPRLDYSARFRKAFDSADPQHRVQVQETLAKVAGLLEASDGDPTPLRQDGGLQYDNYTHRRTSDGRPIGHFRLTRGRRVSCTLEANGTLLLRTFGEHDHVNANP